MQNPLTFIPLAPLATRRASWGRLNCVRPSMCAHPTPRAASMSSTSPGLSSSPVLSEEDLIESVVTLATKWLSEASTSPRTDLVASLSTDPHSVAFAMKFTDLVMRPEDASVAARFLQGLLQTDGVPRFLGAMDAILLRLGGVFAPLVPIPVVPVARLRVQTLVADIIGAVERLCLKRSMQWNVNLLGEAVLGEKEALRRRLEAEELTSRKDVDYVSVKVSGVVSQLNRWDFDGSLQRVLKALRPLFEHAAASQPQVLINLDMEEYNDLEITIAAFTTLLEEDVFRDLDAGIVLQTYLPDCLPALKKLVAWANNRKGRGEIKIRLVKGANLAMEKVDAAMHGWEQAPYKIKEDTDANFLRCLDWVLTPARLRRVRIGVGSHNIFLLAYASVLSKTRGVAHRVGFEMLKGMTPAHTPFLSNQGHGMLLYAPVCRMRDFDVAISYLFRRFEEITSDGNFLRSLAAINSNPSSFTIEEARFRAAAEHIKLASLGPRRAQTRPATASAMTMKLLIESKKFFNEPDTDPALRENRKWALEMLKPIYFKETSVNTITSANVVRRVLERGRRGAVQWGEKTMPSERRRVLSKTADVVARRRGELINAMIYEGKKTFAEADSEVSEAIDFAHYYGLLSEDLPQNFKPFGVISVVSPWNFPVAIAGGGVFSSLAAGNSVILKPSSATSRCGEIVAECAWEAGVPPDALQVVRTKGEEVGKTLVTESDAVILTGSYETAALFRSWKNDIHLFAETSGKNALVITPAADIDLAVADLVSSAFSNTGQRCSASSLAICVGSVYRSKRFLRQLKDAVETLVVGKATDISSVMGPLIKPPEGKLHRALTKLDSGEDWLVKPTCLDAHGAGQLWTPGVRLGVKPGSWFHRTEVFGPVLGVMSAKTLDEAIHIQNSTMYGLTGGIHSLDTTEIDYWLEHVEVGNAYVNRGITGALVQRQSFGGWKDSVVGPGAKAGGPNYVSQLGIVDEKSRCKDEAWLSEAMNSDEDMWIAHFSREHDLTGLFCETNVFRYCPLPRVAVRIGPNADEFERERVRIAIKRCGVKDVVWSEAGTESALSFAQRLPSLDVVRVRAVGEVEEIVVQAAAKANVNIASSPVVANGRVELQNYLREQSISRTRHRFGNLLTG